MATYYATAKVKGTQSSQDIKVQANSGSEAKKIIEMRLGGKVSWIRQPIPNEQTAQVVQGMTGLSIPGRSLLRLLFDLIVRLPDHQWDDLKDHFHGLIRDGQGDVGSIEELLRLINKRRRHVASVRAAKAAEAAQNEGEG